MFPYDLIFQFLMLYIGLSKIENDNDRGSNIWMYQDTGGNIG